MNLWDAVKNPVWRQQVLAVLIEHYAQPGQTGFPSELERGQIAAITVAVARGFKAKPQGVA